MSESIEELSIKNYHENIQYFAQNHPKLLEKISSFESAIDNGHYKERYELEYKDEGYFDVREIKTGSYLYGSDSYRYAKVCADGVDFSKDNSLFKVFYDFEFSSKDLKYYKKMPIDSNGAAGFAPIIDYTNSVINSSMSMKRIEKFIFFGVGLGTHIERVDAKINSKVYLIVEDDLELFRLSMFVTNYQKLSKNSTLFFSIFDDEDVAREVFKEFMAKNFFHNNYIKYFQMLHTNDEKFRLFHSVTASMDYMNYPYHAYFSQFLRPLEYMKDRFRFLDVSGKHKDIFEDKPILIVAAGPSLKKNIEWLKQNSDKFIIFAVTATLATLQKADISPDIVVHLDPFERSYDHIKNIKSFDFLDKSIFLCAAKSNKDVVDSFDKERVFIFEETTNYIESFSNANATCVGSLTYALSLIFDAKNIYLLGLDLALDRSGSTHVSEHANNKELDTTQVDRVDDVFGYLDGVIKVKGNFKDEVYSTLPFFGSIMGIKDANFSYKKDYQQIFNLNDGAYLDGTKPLKIDKVDTKKFKSLDKKSTKEKLLEKFKNISSNHFGEDVVLPIEDILNAALKKKEAIEKYKKTPKNSSVDLYLRRVNELVLDLLDTQDSASFQLTIIYYNYLQFVLPYIYDMLNSKELQDQKRHIKKIDKLLVEKLDAIANLYIEKLENFLEEIKVH